MNVDNINRHIELLNINAVPDYDFEVKAYFDYYGIDFENKINGVKHYFGFLSCRYYEVVCHYYTVPAAVATCFIVHGYYDHSGMYKHLINYCLQRNMNVVIYDLPGHGLSTGERASINNFEEYQLVLETVVSFFKTSLKGPLYLMGQSTGGAIAMDYLLAHRYDEFSKAVLLAPLVRPCHWLRILYLYRLINVFVKVFPRRFSKNSHDEQFLAFTKNQDPLQSKYTHLKWIGALKEWLKAFSKQPSSSFNPLVIQGRHDTTVDWQYNIPIIEKKFTQSKVLYLESAGHQLVNESEQIRDKIFSAIDFYLGL